MVLKEIVARLGFLADVGLDYLTIDRTSSTLSGGEAQRIRLATQIGSSLVGVLYILDEPSIGLHQRDNAKLIATLTRLRDLGNTLLVVEHDEETIRTADWVVDIGPGAGEHGGEVIAAGPLEAVLAEPRSITGAFLRGERERPDPGAPPAGERQRHHRARRPRAQPAGDRRRLPARPVRGGHGRLGIRQEHARHRDPATGRWPASSTAPARRPAPTTRLEGAHHVDKIIEIDQSPIGRTPRSNPATYTGLFGTIRELFAGVPESRVRGYGPGRFSFNVKGGRCENCKGDGILKIEMQFLPDVYVPCEVCKGKRYNREALEIHYKRPLHRRRAGHDDRGGARRLRARARRSRPSCARSSTSAWATSTSVSRRRRSRAARPSASSSRPSSRGGRPGKTLYVLDEPTTGLHFADVEKLLQVLHRLVDAGNTVVVIEHNLDVIKTADWIVDLGPEGGTRGGEIVAEGTPEDVARVPGSATGEYLARVLRGEPLVPLSDVTFADELGRERGAARAASRPARSCRADAGPQAGGSRVARDA